MEVRDTVVPFMVMEDDTLALASYRRLGTIREDRIRPIRLDTYKAYLVKVVEVALAHRREKLVRRTLHAARKVPDRLPLERLVGIGSNAMVYYCSQSGGTPSDSQGTRSA